MGIDTARFLTPVPEYLTCTICLDALRHPVECCSEAHVLCKACYDKVAAAPNPACPSCRRVFKKARPAKTLVRIIDGLAVKCAQHQAGCSWSGPFGNWNDHKKTCTFIPRPCPDAAKGCTFSGKPEALAQHRKDACVFASVLCPRGCGATYVRSTATVHEKTCTEWPCRVPASCTITTTLAKAGVHETFCKRVLQALKDKDEDEAVAVEKLEAKEKEVLALQKEIATMKKELTKMKGAVTRANNAAAKAKAALPPAAEQPPPPPPPAEEPTEPLGKRVSKPSARALEASAAENVPVAGGGVRGRSRSRGAEEGEGPEVAAKRVKVE